MRKRTTVVAFMIATGCTPQMLASDAGTDAYVAPGTDAGPHDAYVAPGTDTGVDAYMMPGTDAGPTPDTGPTPEKMSRATPPSF